MRTFFRGKAMPLSLFSKRNTSNYRGLISNTNNNPNRFVQIGFMWGTFVPHSPDGRGGGCKPSWGLCGIEIGWLSTASGSSPAQASIIDNRLNIYLKISNVPTIYSKYVTTQTIPVYRDISLSPDVCSTIGISSYLIISGEYFFEQCGNSYHFIF